MVGLISCSLRHSADPALTFRDPAVTETESRPRNRALVASFLFTDLVGYSKGSAADQYAEKSALADILRANLAALAPDDYRVKDTGDGALIAFLSNPEHALYMALAIAHDFEQAAAAAGFPSNTLRTGLHIGAVKEAIDLEERPNFVGDGINAAKRIMDFAAPGQITASRSYFEAVSWLDSAYAAMFRHLGASDDKHGRAHELYSVDPDVGVLEKLRAELAPTVRKDVGKPDAESAAPTPQPLPTPQVALPPRPERRSSRKSWLAMVGAAAVIAAAIIIARMPGAPEPVAVTAQPANMAPPPAATATTSTSTPSPKPAPEANTSGSDAAAPMASAPAALAPTTTEGAVPPLPQSAASADETHPAPRDSATAEKVVAPPVSRPAAHATAGAANVAADLKRRTAESPSGVSAANAAGAPGSVPAANTANAPVSDRCRRILQKAALGEPLSPDENRELANSCR